jgi:hypothetical protein
MLQRYPPFVDYPQHLALAAQVRDLLLEQGSGRLVLVTYNGLFELVTAGMGLLLPIEVSGRLVVALTVALAAFSVWKLGSLCGRPATHAFAWLPLAYSLPLSWGFINFTASAALATLSLIGWYAARSARAFLIASLLTGLAHPLGAAVVMVGAVIGVLLRVRTVRALLEVVPLVVWVGVAHANTEPPPHLPWAGQVFFPRWQDRLRFADTVLGSWQGPNDEWLAAAMSGLCVVALLSAVRRVLTDRRLPTQEPFFWLVLLAAATYACAPLAVAGCWFFYQRFGYLLTLWVPAMMPVLPGLWRNAQAGLLVAVGALSVLNFAFHNTGPQGAADAQAIIDAIPRGAKVAPVLALKEGERMNDALHGAPATDALVWAHFPAFAVVRRDAEIPWLFAREHRHFPVRLPDRDEPSLPPVDYGWSRAYHPGEAYTELFDHVLVRTGSIDPLRDPSVDVFGAALADVALLAHHGRFWLFKYGGAP